MKYNVGNLPLQYLISGQDELSHPTIAYGRLFFYPHNNRSPAKRICVHVIYCVVHVLVSVLSPVEAKNDIYNHVADVDETLHISWQNGADQGQTYLIQCQSHMSNQTATSRLP